MITPPRSIVVTLIHNCPGVLQSKIIPDSYIYPFPENFVQKLHFDELH